MDRQRRIYMTATKVVGFMLIFVSLALMLAVLVLPNESWRDVASSGGRGLFFFVALLAGLAGVFAASGSFA